MFWFYVIKSRNWFLFFSSSINVSTLLSNQLGNNIDGELFDDQSGSSVSLSSDGTNSGLVQLDLNAGDGVISPAFDNIQIGEQVNGIRDFEFAPNGNIILINDTVNEIDEYVVQINSYLMSTQLKVDAGETTGSISINTIDDDSYEFDETITINYGTPVNAGEGLGIIGWSAHDSTDAEILACYIQGISESAPTANNQYGAITFSTVNGGTSAYERMRVTKEGYVKTPYQPSFLATFGGNNNTSHNNGDYMKLNSMDHNTGNCYNTSNYRFTAPVAGNYLFYGRANMSGVGSGDYSRSYQVRLFKNGSSQQFHMTRTTLTGYSGSYPDTSTMVCSINLAANDYVQLKVNWETDGTLGTTENLHHHGSLFGGYLIG